MAKRQKIWFQTVRSEGGLLPVDLLQKLSTNNSDVPGLKGTDYHLVPGEKLNEAISRSWNRLLGIWKHFHDEENRESAGSGHAIGYTRDRWLLPLFQELGYGRLEKFTDRTIDEREYLISHCWGASPIHLLGFEVSIDKRTPGVPGATKAAPHSLLQEFLNRSEEHLWGFVSNGYILRVLRDNLTLSRQAFVEFDLQSMFEGEVYSDFVLLWLTCHQSRVECEEEKPHSCWLEKWTQFSADSGTRALESLRDGVEKSIQSLGSGFLSHPDNDPLRESLRSGELSTQDYYRQILRTVYRFLFLLVAEDRDLLHTADSDSEAVSRYREFYSINRLRSMADRFRGTRHHDLWEGLRIVSNGLSSDAGSPSLALPALGSFLWSDTAIPNLESAKLSNRDLLSAIRHLGYFEEGNIRRLINYQEIGSEEFGSVYESLLELHPEIHIDSSTFELGSAAGHERKTTGSYYTPDSLVQCLLDSALEPVIKARLEVARRYSKQQGMLTEETGSDQQSNPVDSIPEWVKAAAEEGLEDLEQASDRYKLLAEKGLLALTVCDPAVGSGHFLIRAGHRIAKHLSAIRSEESEPTPTEFQRAMRDVVSRCLYGVDLNPMAVELCKVTLWIEALDPGRPLSFLDHHIRCGNSLIGTTSELIAQGIPDGAFAPVAGDDRAVASKFKKANKEEWKFRDLEEPLINRDHIPWNTDDDEDNTSACVALDAMGDSDAKQFRKKAAFYRSCRASRPYLEAKFLHDAWCASFLWRKTEAPRLEDDEESHSASPPPTDPVKIDGVTYFPRPITNETLFRLARNSSDCPIWMQNEVERLSAEFQFFHWALEFPAVFAIAGGFDVVVGNPPWEKLQTEEKQFFAERKPEIAKLTGTKRKSAISKLEASEPSLFKSWQAQKRFDATINLLVKQSGKYPLTGVGKFNSFGLFAELNKTLINASGRMGSILPTGIATDDTTKFFFQSVVNESVLVSLIDFENRKPLFEEVDRRFKFCLLTISGVNAPVPRADFAFFLHCPTQLDRDEVLFGLSPEDIKALNPNSLTCPIFRTREDAELTKAIYRQVPVFIRDGDPDGNKWNMTLRRMFNLTDDAHLFHERSDLHDSESDPLLPLYEAKHFHHFDHRWDLAGENVRESPSVTVASRYLIAESDVAEKIGGLWNKRWFIGWRDITNTTNERTVISSVIPWSGVGNTVYLFYAEKIGCPQMLGLSAILNSFVVDYAARQKVGGTHLNHSYMKQLPVVAPSILEDTFTGNSSTLSLIVRNALELCYTAWDLQPFARDCGYDGPPFCWNDDRRFELRCSIDALAFHLYLPSDGDGRWKAENEFPEDLVGLKKSFISPRAAVEYILDTFPIVRRKDEAKYGTFRTKDRILEIYDDVLLATEKGEDWKLKLDVPPSSYRVAHSPRFPEVNRTNFDNQNELRLAFLHHFVRQARREATLPLMEEAWLLLVNRSRDSEAEEISVSLGDNLSQAWRTDGKDQQYKSQGFYSFLIDLLPDAGIAIDPNGWRVSIPENSPLANREIGDEWVNFDVAVALRTIGQRAILPTEFASESEPESVSSTEKRPIIRQFEKVFSAA